MGKLAVILAHLPATHHIILIYSTFRYDGVYYYKIVMHRLITGNQWSDGAAAVLALTLPFCFARKITAEKIRDRFIGRRSTNSSPATNVCAFISKWLMPFIFTPFIAIYDFNSHLAFCVWSNAMEKFLFLLIRARATVLITVCRSHRGPLGDVLQSNSHVFKLEKWMMSIIIIRRITHSLSQHYFFIRFDEAKQIGLFTHTKTNAFERINSLNVQMRAQMNEIHICMNTLVVHSTISSKNPKFDLDKSKQTINCVSLAVNVCVCARWEIMKSDHFSFDLPLSHLWGDISEQKKRQKWTKRGDQLCPLPTKHAIIWCVRFSSQCQHVQANFSRKSYRLFVEPQVTQIITGKQATEEENKN